ncbi:hypothetical protein X767_32240 [Mesorhizobium sp. LSJC264A00]|nr:hypothetical protein X767_32240 [Mesorhizobium sp. LSJC264A00]
MIRRKYAQNRIETLCCLGMDGCRSHRGGRIPALWLKQKSTRQSDSIQFVEVVFRKKKMIPGRHGNELHDVLY